VLLCRGAHILMSCKEIEMSEKKSPAETDMAKMKKKIAERTSAEGTERAPLRSLRKRLKRAQRKKRATASRLAHASGKKKDAKAAS
jgi:hypothetical protein